MKLKLQRPLAIFDLETTGINRKMDRIIDLAVVLLLPDGNREEHRFRVNPGIPIPSESTAIHGITDEDVKDSPAFRDVAPEVQELLKDCDLGGFNVNHFDIPVLMEEFARCGIPFSIEGRRVLDAQRIFHRKEPRDLSAALTFYCGELHLDAHSALDDVLATIRVIEGQFERYDDLPDNMDELDEFCNPRNPLWLDRIGKLMWLNGEAAVNFGKNQGRTLRELVAKDTGFLNWILKSDFPEDTQRIIRNALAGNFPAPPANRDTST